MVACSRVQPISHDEARWLLAPPGARLSTPRPAGEPRAGCASSSLSVLRSRPRRAGTACRRPAPSARGQRRRSSRRPATRTSGMPRMYWVRSIAPRFAVLQCPLFRCRSGVLSRNMSRHRLAMLTWTYTWCQRPCPLAEWWVTTTSAAGSRSDARYIIGQYYSRDLQAAAPPS